MALNNKGLEEKQAFLKEWPIERLENLTLDEYTNRDKSTAFVFWLESTTTNYGSIWGGSAYKFGVFSRENTKNEVDGTMRQTDGIYSWLGKYGRTAEEAFQKVKSMILTVAKASVAGSIEEIDEVDLGNAVKWKIAALYSPNEVVPLYSEKILNKVGAELGLSKKECKTVSKIQRLLIEKKGDDNALELAERYWTKYNAENATMEEQFKSYMNRMNMAQKTIANYLNGNKFTSELLKQQEQLQEDIYELENSDAISEVEEFLKTNEEFKIKNEKGNNMYSAAIAKYKSFIETIENEDVSKTNYWLYAPGEGAEFWDEFYEAGEMGLGWDDLGDLKEYKSKQEIVEKLRMLDGSTGSKKNDSTANWEFANEMNVGDIVIAKRGRSEFLGYGVVTGDYYYDNSKDTFQKRRKVDWKLKGIWSAAEGESIVLKTLTNITPYPDYVKKIKALLNMEASNNTNKVSLPKNLILYGPPGTGKTYRLTNEYKELFVERKQLKTVEDKYPELAEKHSWWEVVVLCMLDLKEARVPELFNHPLMQYRVALSETKSPKNTLWSVLQTYTKKDCPSVNLTKRKEPEIFWKTENSLWSIDIEVVKEQLPELYEDFLWMNEVSDEGNVIERYKTVTFHQSFSYEDFIEGIKPVMGEDQDSLEYTIEVGVFKRMCISARKDPDHDYAIFIDEINRGNVASIFGELITLIEDDKREGEKNALSIDLPYSKTAFSVPGNLYIIGTMNTADRSVEALDTALRRRFSFIEMLPYPKLIAEKGASQGKVGEIDLVKMLTTINKRIEVLVDRDHTIGHAFFMKTKTLADLKDAMANKIIPLLQEYFYGDYKKMEMVIGSGFFTKTAVEEVSFATDEESGFEGDVYEIKNVQRMSDNEFKEAIAGIKF